MSKDKDIKFAVELLRQDDYFHEFIETPDTEEEVINVLNQLDPIDRDEILGSARCIREALDDGAVDFAIYFAMNLGSAWTSARFSKKYGDRITGVVGGGFSRGKKFDKIRTAAIDCANYIWSKHPTIRPGSIAQWLHHHFHEHLDQYTPAPIEGKNQEPLKKPPSMSSITVWIQPSCPTKDTAHPGRRTGENEERSQIQTAIREFFKLPSNPDC